MRCGEIVDALQCLAIHRVAETRRHSDAAHSCTVKLRNIGGFSVRSEGCNTAREVSQGCDCIEGDAHICSMRIDVGNHHSVEAHCIQVAAQIFNWLFRRVVRPPFIQRIAAVRTEHMNVRVAGTARQCERRFGRRVWQPALG